MPEDPGQPGATGSQEPHEVQQKKCKQPWGETTSGAGTCWVLNWLKTSSA